MARISNSASSDKSRCCRHIYEKVEASDEGDSAAIERNNFGCRQNVGEEIAWNAPTFYFNSKMVPKNAIASLSDSIFSRKIVFD